MAEQPSPDIKPLSRPELDQFCDHSLTPYLAWRERNGRFPGTTPIEFAARIIATAHLWMRRADSFREAAKRYRDRLEEAEALLRPFAEAGGSMNRNVPGSIEAFGVSYGATPFHIDRQPFYDASDYFTSNAPLLTGGES